MANYKAKSKKHPQKHPYLNKYNIPLHYNLSFT